MVPKRQRALTPVLLVLALLVPIPLAAARQAPATNRKLAAPARQVTRSIRASLSLPADPALTRVARYLLDLPEPLARDAKARGRILGLTDSDVFVVSAEAEEPEELHRALVEELEKSKKHRSLRFNRGGLAVQRDPAGRWIGRVVLVNRRATLRPLPRRCAVGKTVEVSGRRLPNLEGKLLLVVQRSDGGYDSYDLGSQARFTQRIAVGTRSGTARVQLVLDGPQGPEPTNIASISVGSGEELDRIAPTIAPSSASSDPEQELISLILGTRRASKVPTPALSGQLSEVARSHALDMIENGFFAHFSPRSGSVEDRLARRNIRYRRVRENLAASSTPRDAVRQWLESPSHRENLLAVDVNRLGVGLVEGRGSDGKPVYYAVVVMTASAERQH